MQIFRNATASRESVQSVAKAVQFSSAGYSAAEDGGETGTSLLTRGLMQRSERNTLATARVSAFSGTPRIGANNLFIRFPCSLIN
jgi:hypothetical protein